MISVCDVKRTIGGSQSGTFLTHFIPPEFNRLKGGEVERLGQPRSSFPQNIRKSMSQNERVIQYSRKQARNVTAPFHRLEAISCLGSETSSFEDFYLNLRTLIFSMVATKSVSKLRLFHNNGARWRKHALRVSGDRMVLGCLIVSSASRGELFI